MLLHIYHRLLWIPSSHKLKSFKVSAYCIIQKFGGYAYHLAFPLLFYRINPEFSVLYSKRY